MTGHALDDQTSYTSDDGSDVSDIFENAGYEKLPDRSDRTILRFKVTRKTRDRVTGAAPNKERCLLSLEDAHSNDLSRLGTLLNLNGHVSSDPCVRKRSSLTFPLHR